MFPNGELQQTQPARASVNHWQRRFLYATDYPGSGVRRHKRNGKFDPEDKPMPGVRTLSQFRPVSRNGLPKDSITYLPWAMARRCCHSDPVSLPERYSLADGGTLAGRSWTRLFAPHPLGGGCFAPSKLHLDAQQH